MVLAKPTVVARATKPTAAASSLILRDIMEGLNFCVEEKNKCCVRAGAQIAILLLRTRFSVLTLICSCGEGRYWNDAARKKKGTFVIYATFSRSKAS
jgi:hypothetical protein